MWGHLRFAFFCIKINQVDLGVLYNRIWFFSSFFTFTCVYCTRFRIICIFPRVIWGVRVFGSFMLFIKINFTLILGSQLLTANCLQQDLYNFVIVLHRYQHILSASQFSYLTTLLSYHFTFLSFDYPPIAHVLHHQKLSKFIQAIADLLIARLDCASELIFLHPYYPS
jgi:hypothetical protein